MKNDEAVCCVCNLQGFNWVPGDTPWGEHERHCPDCPLVYHMKQIIRKEVGFNKLISIKAFFVSKRALLSGFTRACSLCNPTTTFVLPCNSVVYDLIICVLLCYKYKTRQKCNQ